MEQKENATNSDIKVNLGLYFSWLPFCGVLISIFSSIIILFRQEKWSFPLLVYMLLPIICFSLISFLINILFKNQLSLSFPYLKGKKKYLTIFAVLLLVALQIVIYMFNTKYQFTTIYLKDIDNIQNMRILML